MADPNKENRLMYREPMSNTRLALRGIIELIKADCKKNGKPIPNPHELKTQAREIYESHKKELG